MFRQGFAEALVVSKKMPKTIMVAVWRKVINRKYKLTRYIKNTLMVHDELNECVPGDRILIKQCRPMSKLKRHMVFEIAAKYKPAEFLRKNPQYQFTKTTGDEVVPPVAFRPVRKPPPTRKNRQSDESIAKRARDSVFIPSEDSLGKTL